MAATLQSKMLLAAQSIGLHVWPGTGHLSARLFRSPSKPDPDGKVTGVEWNPLENGDDALELVAYHKMTVNVVTYQMGYLARANCFLGYLTHTVTDVTHPSETLDGVPSAIRYAVTMLASLVPPPTKEQQ